MKKITNYLCLVFSFVLLGYICEAQMMTVSLDNTTDFVSSGCYADINIEVNGGTPPYDYEVYEEGGEFAYFDYQVYDAYNEDNFYNHSIFFWGNTGDIRIFYVEVRDADGNIAEAQHTITFQNDLGTTEFLEPMLGEEDFVSGWRDIFPSWGSSPLSNYITSGGISACCVETHISGTLALSGSISLGISSGDLLPAEISGEVGIGGEISTSIGFPVPPPDPIQQGHCNIPQYEVTYRYYQKVRETVSCNGLIEREVIQDYINLPIDYRLGYRLKTNSVMSPCGGFQDRLHIKQPTKKNPSGGAVKIELKEEYKNSKLTYSWRGPKRFRSNQKDLFSLSSGVYCVTISDGCCEEEICIGIEDPILLCPLTYETNIVKPSCNGVSNGSLSIIPTTGTPPYQYLWSTGDETSSVNNLEAGSYNVVFADAIGCIRNAVFELTNDVEIAITGAVTESCVGMGNGTISVNVSGGLPPYSFEWNNGSDDQSIQNLSVGTYCVEVKDANGCTQSECFVVGQNVFEEVPLDVQYSCSNQKGSISIVEPNALYTYEWSNGLTGTSIDELESGEYCVFVTNNLGCTYEQCVYIFEMPATEFSAIVSPPNPGESNGSIDVTIHSGIPPFAFDWLTADNVDTEDLENIGSGLHTLIITDGAGCQVGDIFNVGVSNFQIEVADKITTCGEDPDHGCTGAISIEPQGGEAPYSYAWTGPDGFTSTSQNISELCNTGDYTVVVTDAAGVERTRTISLCCCFQTRPDYTGISCEYSLVTFSSTQVVSPSAIGADDGYINLSFYEEEVVVIWSGPDGFEAFTPNINNLKPGTYTVTVKNYCSSRTVSFTLDDCYDEEIEYTSVVTHVDSNTGVTDNGSIVLTPTIDYLDYTYSWIGPDGFTATTPTITDLKPGLYRVNILVGCAERDAAFFIVDCESNIPSIDFIPSKVCTGLHGSKGSVEVVNITGPSDSYTYAWTGPGGFTANTKSINNLEVGGQYCLTVKTAFGCVTTKCVTVEEYMVTITTTQNSNGCDVNQYVCNGDILYTDEGLPPINVPHTTDCTWLSSVCANNTNIIIEEYAQYIPPVSVEDPSNCLVTWLACANDPSTLIEGSNLESTPVIDVNFNTCTLYEYCPNGFTLLNTYYGDYDVKPEETTPPFDASYDQVLSNCSQTQTCIFNIDGQITVYEGENITFGPLIIGGAEQGNCSQGLCTYSFYCESSQTPYFTGCFQCGLNGANLSNFNISNCGLTAEEIFILKVDRGLLKKDAKLLVKSPYQPKRAKFVHYTTIGYKECKGEPYKKLETCIKKAIEEASPRGTRSEARNTSVTDGVDFDKDIVKVYPNPFTNIVSVELNLQEDSDISIDVFNLLGQVVYNKKQTLPNGKQLLELELDEDLGNGIYQIKITNGKDILHTEKLIKTN